MDEFVRLDSSNDGEVPTERAADIGDTQIARSLFAAADIITKQHADKPRLIWFHSTGITAVGRTARIAGIAV